jgi:hypothetical protein
MFHCRRKFLWKLGSLSLLGLTKKLDAYEGENENYAHKKLIDASSPLLKRL